MGDTGVGAALGLGPMGIFGARSAGKRAERMAKEAAKRQEKAQARATARAASQRLAHKAEARALRKKKPKMSAILLRRRGVSRQGIASTFLTGPSGDFSSGAGGSYGLGD